ERSDGGEAGDGEREGAQEGAVHQRERPENEERRGEGVGEEVGPFAVARGIDGPLPGQEASRAVVGGGDGHGGGSLAAMSLTCLGTRRYEARASSNGGQGPGGGISGRASPLHGEGHRFHPCPAQDLATVWGVSSAG